RRSADAAGAGRRARLRRRRAARGRGGGRPPGRRGDARAGARARRRLPPLVAARRGDDRRGRFAAPAGCPPHAGRGTFLRMPTGDGWTSEPLREALRDALAGRVAPLATLLARHGGGPDPRPNLRLAAAFGDEMAGDVDARAAARLLARLG